MSIRLGGTTIPKVVLGGTTIGKAYIGTTVVFTATAAALSVAVALSGGTEAASATLSSGDVAPLSAAVAYTGGTEAVTTTLSEEMAHASISSLDVPVSSSLFENSETLMPLSVSGNYDGVPASTWEVVSGGGTITSAGVYTAPSVDSNVTVTLRVTVTVNGTGGSAKDGTSATKSMSFTFTVLAYTPLAVAASMTGGTETASATIQAALLSPLSAAVDMTGGTEAVSATLSSGDVAPLSAAVDMTGGTEGTEYSWFLRAIVTGIYLKGSFVGDITYLDKTSQTATFHVALPAENVNDPSCTEVRVRVDYDWMGATIGVGGKLTRHDLSIEPTCVPDISGRVVVLIETATDSLDLYFSREYSPYTTRLAVTGTEPSTDAFLDTVNAGDGNDEVTITITSAVRVGAEMTGATEVAAATLQVAVTPLSAAVALSGGTETVSASLNADQPVPLSAASAFAGGTETCSATLSSDEVAVTPLSAAVAYTGGTEAASATLSSDAATQTPLSAVSAMSGGTETAAATLYATLQADPVGGAISFAMSGGTTTAGAEAEVATGTGSKPVVTYSDPMRTVLPATAFFSHSVGISSYQWQVKQASSTLWSDVYGEGTDSKTIIFLDVVWVGYNIRITWVRNGVTETGPTATIVDSAPYHSVDQYPVPESPSEPIDDQGHSFVIGQTWTPPPSATDGYAYLPYVGSPLYSNVDWHGPRNVTYSFVTQRFGDEDSVREAAFSTLLDSQIELSDEIKAWIRRAVAVWNRYFEATLVEVEDGPDVRVRIGYAGTSASGFVTDPQTSNAKSYMGYNTNTQRLKQWGMRLWTHEFGHLMGLAHPESSNNVPKRGVYSDPVMETQQSSNWGRFGFSEQLWTHGDIMGMWHVSGSAPGAPPISPDACRNFSVTSLNGGSATLYWDAPVRTGGRPITEYRVQCGNMVAYVPAGTLTHSFIEVPAGTYECHVRAVNRVGIGIHSDHANVTVAAATTLLDVACAFAGGTEVVSAPLKAVGAGDLLSTYSLNYASGSVANGMALDDTYLYVAVSDGISLVADSVIKRHERSDITGTPTDIGAQTGLRMDGLCENGGYLYGLFTNGIKRLDLSNTAGGWTDMSLSSTLQNLYQNALLEGTSTYSLVKGSSDTEFFLLGSSGGKRITRSGTSMSDDSSWSATLAYSVRGGAYQPDDDELFVLDSGSSPDVFHLDATDGSVTGAGGFSLAKPTGGGLFNIGGGDYDSDSEILYIMWTQADNSTGEARLRTYVT